ncbi:hypothetical protein EJB05_01573 [Eragrostis curvula]|uniref:Extensin domain-containing protein n=1 Tax=Eragrostis curvula TaxID=38414 RepID=A0A5J9WPW0_9POAL|nr:hypothetical protein EJB05_01572 [Eragrostis curvula]TVU50209.1 hypothetical protein EJB05_01573 [Eragrostis curvula]
MATKVNSASSSLAAVLLLLLLMFPVAIPSPVTAPIHRGDIPDPPYISYYPPPPPPPIPDDPLPPPPPPAEGGLRGSLGDALKKTNGSPPQGTPEESLNF